MIMICLQPNTQKIVISDSGSPSMSHSADSVESKNPLELSNFSLVFVITAEEAAKDNGRRYEMYKQAVFQVTSALKHEQLRCGYLSNEVEAMLLVRERWLFKQCNVKKEETPPSTLLALLLLLISIYILIVGIRSHSINGRHIECISTRSRNEGNIP